MHSISNIKFIKDIVRRETINTKTGEIISYVEVVIKIRNLENNKSRIHRMTDFLSQYRNNKPKYVADIADNVVLFLNHIYFELNTTELKNIENLTFDIGANFLQNYSIGKTKNTVLKMERVLTKFYYFLTTKGILHNISTNDFKLIEKHNNIFIDSPFIGIYKQFSIPSTKPLHTLDPKLVFVFLDKVAEVSPSILLGVYMQFFGGLRISEVIGLEYANLSIKGANAKNGMVVNIKSTNLREDLKTSPIKQSKKPRKQVVIAIPQLVTHIYSQHLKHYKSTATDAIFINTKGLPMTADMYRYYFNKAKKAFIKSLLTTNDITLNATGLFLQNQKWSTHIGRGVFSNLIAEQADNMTEIAAWRGDSNLNSALAYVTDTKKIEEKIITVMNDLYVNYINVKS